MLQVAFGQSKYFSDNLKQNVERGIRQKLRRGEWLTKAPFGYVNNVKTRNIEPDKLKSRLVVRAFKEFATGKHCYESISQFLAEHGVVTRNGTPLSKCAVSAMLCNRAYLGFVKHHGEWYDGTFAPILSPTLFEAVQKVLKTRQKPRKSKIAHPFHFLGFARCGECGSMFTAQYSTNRFGAKYSYYRCTKKFGKCEQGYLREEKLVSQIRERLQQITLPDDWIDYMTRKTDEWEKEENVSSGSVVERIRGNERETQEKLDNLITLYLDGDIPKANYLAKKDELLLQKVSLAHKMDSARQERKNWVEPLREWILDMKKATQLVSSDNFFEIRDYFKKVGTNLQLRDKSVSVSFCPPTEFAFACKTDSDFAHPLLLTARKRAGEFSDQVMNCAPGRNRTAIKALEEPRFIH